MKDYHPGEKTEKARRKLPHWQQQDCTYFITFRLHDSLPAGKFAAWNEDRHRWLRSRNLNPELPLEELLEKLDSKQKETYYKTFWKCYHDMLDDCYGSCLMRDSYNAKIVADALLFFDKERYVMGDFVIMPNHVHLLVTPIENRSISELLHSWKRFSARKINEKMQQDGRLWQPESYGHIVRNEPQLQRIQSYIKKNPQHLKVGEYYYHDGRTAL